MAFFRSRPRPKSLVFVFTTERFERVRVNICIIHAVLHRVVVCYLSYLVYDLLFFVKMCAFLGLTPMILAKELSKESPVKKLSLGLSSSEVWVSERGFHTERTEGQSRMLWFETPEIRTDRLPKD